MGVLLVAALCGVMMAWVLQGHLSHPGTTSAARKQAEYASMMHRADPLPLPAHHMPTPRSYAPTDMPQPTGKAAGVSSPVTYTTPMERPTEVMQPEPKQKVTFAAPASSTFAAVPKPDHWVWKDHAVAVDVPKGAPMLAILIDDMGDREGGPQGSDLKETSYRAVRALPGAVSLAFFPWYPEAATLAHTARKMGHEILVHMPMEPLPHVDKLNPGHNYEAGANALKTDLSLAEVARRLDENMKPYMDVAVGLNNHMGSKFTRWPDGMRVVLAEAQKRGLLFVDSRTIAHTATDGAKKGLVLPVLGRDVFLDDNPTPEAVKAQLEKAVALAKKKGHALAIGHPLPDTLDVLEAELPKLQGVVLVPVTALIK
jgi:polysaccharide deacetylase 2 family uncharacterized protein YibQ